MAPTLELYDGSTTIDLLSTPYFASRQVRFGPPPAKPVLTGQMLRGVHYSPRTVEVDLNMKCSSVSDLRDKVRDLESMCAVAESRMSIAQGTVVKMKCQMGDTDADDAEYRVLRGELSLPQNLLQEPTLSTVYAAPGARLSLLVEPFGRLAAVTPTASTLENEQDGANLNYVDFTSIEGTHGAPMQLKIHDPSSTWSGSKKMWIAKRSGERYNDDLFYQGEEEASSNADTNPYQSGGSFSSDGAYTGHSDASGGQVSRMQWSASIATNLKTGYLNTCYAQYDIAGTNIPNGLFRVLVRIRSNTDIVALTAGEIGYALGYTFGSLSKTPVSGDEQTYTTLDTFETLDLGEISLPPASVPDGYTAPTLNLKIYGTLNATSGHVVSFGTENITWDIDYIFLVPLDEGLVIVNDVNINDRILLDSVSDTPGIYLLNGSDVVQKFADFTGAPLTIGPEDTRIYVVRDDTGDPSSVQFTVTPKYTPLVAGI